MPISDEGLKAAIDSPLLQTAEAAVEAKRQEQIRIQGLAYDVQRKSMALAKKFTEVRRKALEAQISDVPEKVYLDMFQEARRIAEKKQALDAQYSYLTVFAEADAELAWRQAEIDLLQAQHDAFETAGEQLTALFYRKHAEAGTHGVEIKILNDSEPARLLLEAAKLTPQITLKKGELLARTEQINGHKRDASPALFNI